MYIQYDDLLLE